MVRVADGVAEAFQLQAFASRDLGSPLYAELCERCIEDLKAGGPVASLLEGWVGNPVLDALVLRVLGGVHRFVLEGSAPELARFYPSVGGTPRWPELWDSFRKVVETRRDELRPRLAQQVQTNEISRSAALIGGFLTIAQHTGLPLRLLEIGSSAGLNLFFDRYRYELGEQTWGDPAAKVIVRAVWHGMPPVFPARVRVAERSGCDLHPVDVCSPDDLRKLESFVWPDQLERLNQLRAAFALAREDPPRLTQSSAAPWVARQLEHPIRGLATVVFHSIMWWYLSPDEQRQVTDSIERAGEAATPEAPVAWLQMELRTRQQADIVLRLWPGGHEQILGVSHPHGKEIAWRGEHG